MFPWMDNVRTRQRPGAPWLVEHYCETHGFFGNSGVDPEAQRQKRLQHERLTEHVIDSELWADIWGSSPPDAFAGPEFKDYTGGSDLLPSDKRDWSDRG